MIHRFRGANINNMGKEALRTYIVYAPYLQTLPEGVVSSIRRTNIISVVNGGWKQPPKLLGRV